ncbi:MAG: hypothetical protein J6Q87_07425 [Clostridia bacterium]|nr:hypothetical protein [Clostridia bacterium]
MSNCPKCNEKLSPFYMKQNCPKCGTNLVYYDLDNRLKADHEKAMKEQEAVDRVLNNIKTSAFGGGLQITRFVLMFSPLLWMCLPMFKANDGESITLISVIMEIINGGFDFSNPSYLFPFVTMVCIILFSLMVIISSLFSIGKKALKRNISFSSVNMVVLLIVSTMSIKYGTTLGMGLFIVVATYLLQFVLHKLVDKKLNKE